MTRMMRTHLHVSMNIVKYCISGWECSQGCRENFVTNIKDVPKESSPSRAHTVRVVLGPSFLLRGVTTVLRRVQFLSKKDPVHLATWVCIIVARYRRPPRILLPSLHVE